MDGWEMNLSPALDSRHVWGVWWGGGAAIYSHDFPWSFDAFPKDPFTALSPTVAEDLNTSLP